jgi:hypothetical protein
MMMMNRYIEIVFIIIGVAFIFASLYALIQTIIEVKRDNIMMNKYKKILNKFEDEILSEYEDELNKYEVEDNDD